MDSSIIGRLFMIAGSLCLFLYGMKVMSDGIQQGAGSKMQGVVKFMTGRRISAVLTGLGVTAVIQSSSATTVMVVSFVNAGLLSLEQAIGVIMGANIGTTITAWIVSLAGFSLSISVLALPAIGVGFLLHQIKWKHQELGNMILGLGILFLGLDFLTKSMPSLNAGDLGFILNIEDYGYASLLIALGIGVVITLILHSSSASTAIIITMAFNSLIDMNFGCAMILGANIGTTIDAALAAIGTKTTAKRAALVHILFNVIGSAWALILIKPLIQLVYLIVPGGLTASVTIHLAMFHTVFNLLNTIIFFPFVKQFAFLVTVLIKEKESPVQEGGAAVYRFPYIASSMRDTPELNILRAEKEIRDMAALVFTMYSQLRKALFSINAETVEPLIKDLEQKEEYADQMREVLTSFLLECTRHRLNYASEVNIGHLFRIIADLEDMTDHCYSMSLLLARSVRKNQIFKQTEIDALNPYMGQVEEFLTFVGDHLGGKLAYEQSQYAATIEAEIDESRDKLRKLGRRRIEEGEDVKTELLFIDFVRRIERIGDYCNGISKAMASME